jgi:hypothetical protein
MIFVRLCVVKILLLHIFSRSGSKYDNVYPADSWFPNSQTVLPRLCGGRQSGRFNVIIFNLIGLTAVHLQAFLKCNTNLMKKRCLPIAQQHGFLLVQPSSLIASPFWTNSKVGTGKAQGKGKTQCGHTRASTQRP